MELIITAPTEETAIQAIEFNFEELKKQISTQTEKYKKLVYADKNIKDAKRDRANLNKLSKAINDKRIQIKKKYLAPYTEFEKKIKVLDKMVQDAAGNIDQQIKSFEEQQREKKLSEVKEIFNKKVQTEGVETVATWERLKRSEWGNASKSTTQIEKEIEDAVKKIKEDLDLIEKTNSPFWFEMKEEYLKTLNLQDVLRKGQELEAMAERKKTAEAQKKEQKGLKEEVKTPVEHLEEIPSPETEPTFVIKFAVIGTKKQFIDLKEFMNINNIEYSQI